ncbi:hypothetical protein Trydic_g1120 [Trypoxylus dichotomus]
MLRQLVFTKNVYSVLLKAIESVLFSCFEIFIMPFTVEQDAFILMAHYRSGTRDPEGYWTYSLQSCIDHLLQHIPDFHVDYDTFKYEEM